MCLYLPLIAFSDEPKGSWEKKYFFDRARNAHAEQACLRCIDWLLAEREAAAVQWMPQLSQRPCHATSWSAWVCFSFFKILFPCPASPFSAFSCFASLLLFVSAFLLLCISASTLLCFTMLLCFSAFLLLCFSASPLLPFWLLKLKCPRTHV